MAMFPYINKTAAKALLTLTAVLFLTLQPHRHGKAALHSLRGKWQMAGDSWPHPYQGISVKCI